MIHRTALTALTVLLAASTAPSRASVVPSPLTPAAMTGGDTSGLATTGDIAADAVMSVATDDFAWSTAAPDTRTPSAIPWSDGTTAVSPSDAVTPTLPGDAIEREPAMAFVPLPAAGPMPAAPPRSSDPARNARPASGSLWSAVMPAAILVLALGAVAAVVSRAGGVAPALERMRAAFGAPPGVRQPRRRSSRGSRA